MSDLSGWRLPKESIPAEVAYQAVRDELRPDVDPQLNLATFITTRMEPEARWRSRTPTAPGARPNLVMGPPCTFAGPSSALTGTSRHGRSPWRATGSALIRTPRPNGATRTPSAWSRCWAAPSTAPTNRCRRCAPRWTQLQSRDGVNVPVHVDAASGGLVAPFLDPQLMWDFRLPQVVSINTSGHKYGLTTPGLGGWCGVTLVSCPPSWVRGRLPQGTPVHPDAHVHPARRTDHRAVLPVPPTGRRGLSDHRPALPRPRPRARRPPRRHRRPTCARRRRQPAGRRVHHPRPRRLHRDRPRRAPAPARLARACLHAARQPNRSHHRSPGLPQRPLRHPRPPTRQRPSCAAGQAAWWRPAGRSGGRCAGPPAVSAAGPAVSSVLVWMVSSASSSATPWRGAGSW